MKFLVNGQVITCVGYSFTRAILRVTDAFWAPAAIQFQPGPISLFMVHWLIQLGMLWITNHPSNALGKWLLNHDSWAVGCPLMQINFNCWAITGSCQGCNGSHDGCQQGKEQQNGVSVTPSVTANSYHLLLSFNSTCDHQLLSSGSVSYLTNDRQRSITV